MPSQNSLSKFINNLQCNKIDLYSNCVLNSNNYDTILYLFMFHYNNKLK